VGPVATTVSDAAARYLVAARRSRTPGARLPAEYRPRDFNEAFAIQGRVGALLDAPIGGWKCALPTADKVIVAPIYASGITAGSACTAPSKGGTVRVEPEIAFVLGHDLPPRAGRYSSDDMRTAIAQVRLSLEVLGCRYAEPDTASFLELFADGLFNDGLCVGPEVRGRLARDLSGCVVTVDGPGGRMLRHEGRHPDGDPLMALCWLGNFLAERGSGLTAGQVVITGSYAGVLDLPIGTELRIGFGDLGAMSVEFSARE
jgi:2-keto-4-pentenoate hydratase